MDFEPSIQSYTESQDIASFLEMQRVILDKQSRGQPFFIGRLSGNEPNLCSHIIAKIEPPNYLMHNILFGAGIQFKTAEDVESYVKTYTESFRSCDLVGAWSGGAMNGQTQLFYNVIRATSGAPEGVGCGKFSGAMTTGVANENRSGRKWSPISARGLEPYYYMNLPEYAYHRIFENKKVLIISSHSKTIKSQLKRLDSLFHVPIFPPTAKLFVHKPPQQNGDNHDDQSWQVHFETLQNDIKKIREGFFDFDIALVSCGGFGMPISAFIHEKLGKSVIYVGGALQLFFGVMGSRWRNSEDILKHANENWVNPLDVDKPANPHVCESGCYW